MTVCSTFPTSALAYKNNDVQGVTIIGDNALSYFSNLSSEEIPDGVENIDLGVFSDCINLTSITIPESETSISETAFEACENVTIKGYKNPYAEQYAKNNSIKFETLNETPLEPIITDKMGDLDGDGEITSADSLAILRQSVGLENLTPEQIKLCDVDGDKEVTSADALEVLRYSVGLATTAKIG